MPRVLSVVDTLAVHHSASPNHWPASRIRQIHLDKGWWDVGYHFLIERDGTLRYGRPLTIMGAHARGANAHSWGVCVIGDNTTPDEHAGRSWRANDHSWTPEQWETLANLIVSCRMLVPALKVVGHHEVGSTRTVCPGISGATLRAHLGIT